MRLRVSGLTLIPLVLVVTSGASGAAGAAAQPGATDQWPADGPRKVFTATGMGVGFSSVAVTGGRIYTMGDRRDGQYALAFNEADGNPIWATRVGEVHQDEYGGPRATPTVDGNLVFLLA